MSNINADQDVFDLLTGVSLSITQQTAIRESIGSLGNLVEVNLATAGAPNIITNLENNKLFTNDGATVLNVHTLPPCELGLRYTFFVKETAGIQINAGGGAGEHIRLGDAGPVSNCSSGIVGAVIEFICVTNTAWIAVADDPVDWKCDGLATGIGTHGEYYFSTPVTTVLTSNTPVKALGTTTPRLLHGFSHANNRLIYDGIGGHDFLVTASLSVAQAATGATLCSILVAKNGVVEPGLEIRQKLANSSDEVAMAITGSVQLTTNDYIEMWLKSTTGDNVSIQLGIISITDEGPTQV